MPISWSEMNNAYWDAHRTIKASDQIIDDMARMITDRLRSSSVSPHALTALKKELAAWDMRRKSWKD